MIKISVLTSLYRCEIYLEDFFRHVGLICNPSEVEYVFIHNDPLPKEKEIIFKQLKLNEYINYQYIEVERESLYKSWNRGIIQAKGEFIAVWNVDDVRYPYSLLVQKEALCSNLSVGLIYGNFEIEANMKVSHVEVRCALNKIGLQKFQNGSFIMWRKSIHDAIGFFDEQLLIVGDQDFWYRVTCNYYIIKTSSNLGKFLFSMNSALSSPSSKNSIERCIIAKRYGFWSPVNLFSYLKVKRFYDCHHLYYFSHIIELKNINKTPSVELIKTFMKSIILTMLFVFNSKYKRFAQKNF